MKTQNITARRRENILKSYAALCKIQISFFSTLSAVTGYMLTGHYSGAGLLASATGVFLLACGACAFNQYQERETDALMERTRTRPIPSGLIPVRRAFFVSAILIMSGFLVLLVTGTTAALLGAAAVIWYNGVYTRLKRVTAFAPVPGALTGAIPPAIGWSAAGAGVLDFRLPALCAFFFIWQVPHFWLLSLQYSDEYKKAGLPAIGEAFSKEQITRITFIWILSTAISGLALPLFIFPSPHFVNAVFLGASLWLVFSVTGKRFCLRPFHEAFKRINLYMLLFMLILNGKLLII